MSKKPAQIDVNLIPKDPFFETPIGKVLKWALSIGRYIVIFTELVVILSFVTRFNLDRQITDLNDSINRKEMIIDSYGELEDNVREAQEKINQYQQIEQQTDIIDVFPKLSQITPASIRLDNLIVQPNKVVLSGTAFAEDALSLFINNAQLSPDLTNVSIDRIETGDRNDPGFHFRMTANTRKVELKKIEKDTSIDKVNIFDRTQGLDKIEN